MTQELLRDNSLPYREVIMRPGERVDYGIEWAGWLARRWSPGTLFAANTALRPKVSTGFQYVCSGGTSGAVEPVYPTTIGASVVDGSQTLTCQAIDTTSLATSISSSSWSADTPLATPTLSLTGTNATAFFDVPANVPDGDYYIRNTISLANLTTKIGTFLVKVRKGQV